MNKAGPPFFTASGIRGYVAEINYEKRVVLGGTKGPAIRRIDLWMDLSDTSLGLAKRPAFSPDGKKIAYRATNKSDWDVIVAGDTIIDQFDLVGPPVFSPDGKKVAFGARRGDELWWKVVDVP